MPEQHEQEPQQVPADPAVPAVEPAEPGDPGQPWPNQEPPRPGVGPVSQDPGEFRDGEPPADLPDVTGGRL